ncbi:MAG TPA: DUF454 family protein [Ilumatobacteraceae bacterium]|nr:DUF454 family protein [Ilumatobacteraceae bacterium]
MADDDERTARNPIARLLWTVGGFVLIGIGLIGIVVPGLPTTGFLVAAAACFSRSSPRFERWVLNLPTFGPMVRDYRAGLGMPRRAKVAACTSIVVACSLSSFLAVERWWVRIAILVLGAIGVAWILFRIPTRAEPTPAELAAREQAEYRRGARAAMSRPSRIFRIVAFVETLTWVGLLAGMAQKYLFDGGERGVALFGPIHGTVVLVYFAALIWAGTANRWNARTFILGALASVPPFASLQFERWAEVNRKLR